jgi:hypothetical protein
MTMPHFPDDWEILSAYLDGQLSNREMEQVRQRLEAQPDLQRALDELQRTRMVLRSAPRRRVPHNFTLSPAMVPQRRPWLGLAPAFSFASALAVVLLVLSFAFTLLPGLNASTEMLAAAPAASQAPKGLAPSVPQATDQSQSNAQPPIIAWGGTGGMGGGGGGIGGGPATPPLSGSELAPTVDTANATPAVPALVQPAPPTVPPTLQATPEATAEPAQRNAAPLQGTGPILGIRPTQEVGKIEVTPESAQTLSYAALEPAPTEQPSFLARNLGAIQIGLVVLAVGFALAAILLRRRS